MLVYCSSPQNWKASKQGNPKAARAKVLKGTGDKDHEDHCQPCHPDRPRRTGQATLEYALVAGLLIVVSLGVIGALRHQSPGAVDVRPEWVDVIGVRRRAHRFPGGAGRRVEQPLPRQLKNHQRSLGRDAGEAFKKVIRESPASR